MSNLILKTDSYKLTHAPMYPEGTTGVYSYLEARQGAAHDELVFFGLQPLLQKLQAGVTAEDVREAKELSDAHLGPGIFNEEGWMRVVNGYGGRLPLQIKAVPEGTILKPGDVMMTVENLDSRLPWLTNAVESLLLHIWYPITVASTSRQVKKNLKRRLELEGAPLDGLDFMLHDFGYRGVSSDESAAIGGAAHLVNFQGTDTLLAIKLLQDYYDADMPAFSVPATEHSVMTSLGVAGEQRIVSDLLDNYPTGILSIVADSYDIFGFVEKLGTVHREKVLERDGKVVVRPDSGDPITQIPTLLHMLWDSFGGIETPQGYKVLNPKLGILWGDGLDGPGEIEQICAAVQLAGFSVSNLVFGMGGGLLQKVNRDTERFAFKCSAQKRNGVWLDVQKNPLDTTKRSKAGRLTLRQRVKDGSLVTVREDLKVGEDDFSPDLLQTVFDLGVVTTRGSLDDVRQRASL
jgi:nicotinamide phosphoribosyltransferase